MRSREEAVAFIKDQLDGDGKDGWPPRVEPYRLEITKWHYGMIELRRLMDFIYGQEPQSDKERID